MRFFSNYSEERINQVGIKTWVLIVFLQMPAYTTPTWRQFRSQIASGAALWHSLFVGSMPSCAPGTNYCVIGHVKKIKSYA